MVRGRMRPFGLLVAIVVGVACAAGTPSPPPAQAQSSIAPTAATAIATIATVAPSQRPAAPRPARIVVIGFDNYHFDDIQRAMPNLWGFIQQGAWTPDTHHTLLPSRTAPGFASIASGLYPDRHGAIYNNYLASGVPRAGFSYWENLLQLSPPPFLSEPPWVAFNRAGYDVGAIGWQGLVIENADEAKARLGRAPTSEELDRIWGLALHRKDGTALLGSAEIPALRDAAPDGWRNGWSAPLKTAPVTLPMTAALLKSGVPIVFAFLDNTHQRCAGTEPQSCQRDLKNGTFDDLLRADDDAFLRFFIDLRAAGITTDNTLFILTTDEGDRYNENFARVIDVSDVQPSIDVGPAGLFYGADADALADALARKPGIQAITTKAAMKAVHIAAGDARTPTYAAFSDADAFFFKGPCSNCGRWNHGTLHPDIQNIWLALRGPGVNPGRFDAFTDHPDVVATMRWVLGMPQANDLDGVPIFAALAGSPAGDVAEVRSAYKRVNAPFGDFSTAILKMSTAAVRAGPDARARSDVRIGDLSVRRDALAAEMHAAIIATPPLPTEALRALVGRANALVQEAAR